MKILVAMSGGVDSTVTAHLLKKAGHEVIGINFNFVGASSASPDSCRREFNEREKVVSNELDEIAEKLKIKIIYKDYACEFREKIIKSFVENYETGRTPNPCALCNATMKFDKLLKHMKEEGCDMVATGHYANVGARKTRPHTRYFIKKSSNLQKDQSYMLYRLSQEQLSHIIFPLGNMDKNDVRKIAAELGLSVADKKDSQDVCFIDSSIDYREFIKGYEFGDDYKEKIARGILKENDILSKPYCKKGEFVDLDGKVLGYHSGIINYTIGQRKGLNIAFGERKFVVKIDAKNNQVVLGNNDDLMSSEFKMKDVVFSGHDEDIVGTKFYAKLRYRHEGTLCEVVEKNGDEYTCHLLSKVRAITSGQSAVFYDENEQVMFGGIIV